MPHEKRIIFTVTSGRSGSAYLSQLLQAVPGLHAEHEPEPNFAHVMRRVQHNPAIAFAFLREHKLPAIAKVAEPVYAETSHLTCKGFIEPMIQLGLRPGLIFLRRSPREVAWSLQERNTIPGRTPLGCAYLLEPRDPFVLPLIGWETLSDYQLCFWYALEIEHRCLRYVALASELGLPTADDTKFSSACCRISAFPPPRRSATLIPVSVDNTTMRTPLVRGCNRMRWRPSKNRYGTV
jgi:hypothetical protein